MITHNFFHNGNDDGTNQSLTFIAVDITFTDKYNIFYIIPTTHDTLYKDSQNIINQSINNTIIIKLNNIILMTQSYKVLHNKLYIKINMHICIYTALHLPQFPWPARASLEPINVVPRIFLNFACTVAFFYLTQPVPTASAIF